MVSLQQYSTAFSLVNTGAVGKMATSGWPLYLMNNASTKHSLMRKAEKVHMGLLQSALSI